MRHLFFTVILSLLGPLLIYAVDLNKNLLPDDWETAHGFSAGVYAETNLIGWWQLDETNGVVAADRSTNNLPLTVISSGSNTWSTNGLFYGATQLDGAGRYLQAQTNAAYNLTNFTFSVWVNTTNNNDNQVIAQWVNTSGYGWRVDTATNGQVRARFDTAAATAQIFQSTNQPPVTVKNGSWHHVALSYASTNHLAQVYVDGVLETQGTVSGDVDSTAANFVVGQADGANWWSGLIDEIRLYNRVLAANEIGLLPETYTDSDGDGLTNWQEYQAGSDPANTDTDGDGVVDGQDSYPLDFYNNVLPSLTKVSGDGQVTALSSFASSPLIVQVKNASNSAVVNAPVTFTVTQGTGKLAVSGSGAPQAYSTLTVRTDASGNAQVYFQTGAANGAYDQITAQVQSGALISQATFTEKALTGADALSLWLMADSGIVTATNSNVTQWVDQSAGQHILSQSTTANQPVLQTDSYTQNKTLRFNGNQILYSSDLLSCNQDITFIVVSSVDNPNNQQYSIGLGAPSTGTLRSCGYVNSLLWFANWGGGTTAGASSIGGRASITAYTLTRSSGLIQGFVSGSNVGQGTTSFNNLSSGITIGAASSNFYGPLQGSISEVLVFNRVLSSFERLLLESSLADKYGLYHTNATWPLSYSTAVQSEITRNRWNKSEADAYAVFLQNNSSLTLPFQGLSLWLKADAGVTTNTNGNVIQWLDQTINNRNIYQDVTVSQPLLISNGLNAKPTVRFDGVNDYLKSTINSWPGGTELSLFVVTKGSNYQSLIRAQSGDNYFVYPWSTNQMFILSTDGGTGGGISSGFVPLQWNIGAIVYKTNDRMTSYLNGVLVGDRASGGNALPAQQLLLGSYIGSSEFSSADVAEVLYYNRKLSGSERLQAEVYLADKYAIYHPNATWPLVYSSGVQAAITRNQWSKAEADAYVALQQGNPGMMTNGLKAWFKADAGVTQSGGTVSGWVDQTGNFTATQSTTTKQPSYIASDVNGKPGLRFSGGQCLYSGNTLGVGANADMTMIVVSSTTNPGAQGYSVQSGNNTNGRGRGIGYYASRQILDCYGYYAQGAASPSANTFVVEEATINSALNTVTFSRNGLQTATASISSVGTVTPGLMVGAASSQVAYWQGDINEILIYDHQLTTAERIQVESYLGSKYAISTPVPVISPDGGVYKTAQSVTLTPPAGVAAYYTLDGSEPTLDSFLYSAPFTVSSSATLKVKYYFGNGQFSGTAGTDFIIDSGLPITTSGLNLWLRADVGVMKDGSNKVSSWKDQSGRGLHAGQTLTTAQPVWSSSGPNAKPTVTLNGTASYLQCPPGFADLTQGVTFFVVGRPTSTGNWARFFDFGIGAGNNNIFLARSGTSQDCTVTLMNGGTSANLYGTGILVQNSVQVLSVAADSSSSGYIRMYKDSKFINQTASLTLLNITKTTNYIGKSNWNDALYQGDISEVLFYNRKLSDLERMQVDTYLGEKYGTPVYRPSVTPDGGIFKTPQTISISSLSGAIAYYTVDGTDPSLSSQSYSAPFVVSNSATVKVRYYYGTSPCTGVASADIVIDPNLPITTSSLSLWLCADKGVIKDGSNKVSLWKDQSGNGMHAAQTLTTAQPTWGTLGAYGKPTLILDGTTNFLQCPAGFADLTNGVSAFVVMRPTAVKNYARFFDFGNGAGSNNIFMSRTGTSQDCLYQNMNGGTARYFSGTNVITQNTLRVTSVTDDTTSSGYIKMYADGVYVGQAASQPLLNIAKIYNYIGKSNWSQDPLYQGDIAEILFYNRRLTDTERADVDRYLHRKYFDYDENGILDTWELQYFGQIGTVPGADADLDGLTNLQEYQLGGNPTDYYSRNTGTVTPTLTVVSGNNQISSPSTFSLNPLVVQLSGGSVASWQNAPVTFTIATGSGQLAATNVGAPQMSTTLTVLADGSGQAQAYYYNPANTQTGTVQSIAGASLAVSFTEETVNYWRPGILAGGAAHALSVKKDGTLWAWGENQSGQLGVGGNASYSSPVQISSLSGVALVSAGAEHSMALKENGTVWTWGKNQQGQLGDGSITNRTTPVLVNGLTGVISVAAGDNHSVALKSDGTLWTWGADKTSSPVQVGGLSNIISIAAGKYHSAVVKNDGTVWTWEAAGSGAPAQVSSLSGIVSVAAGDSYYLALDGSGNVWAWGSNISGQLGDGTTTDRSSPVMISSFTNVKAIAANGQHSLALKNDGTVWAWGSNSQGELGDETTTNRTVPIQVTGLPVIAAIAAGDQFSMAASLDGSVWVWGKNDGGQLGIGSTTNKNKAFMNPRYFVTSELDQNGDGILDSWEMANFGTTNVNLQEDADGDGMSNLQEYLEGSNPHDYYSQGSRTITPVLTLIGGNNQVGAASTPTDNPLVVRVTDSLTGYPLDNATVTFTTTRGAGKVAASGALGAQGYPSLEVHADGAGYANVYYQFPGSETQSGIISAVAGLAPFNAQVNFTATLLPPPDVAGLCLWFRADTGVTSDANGKVSGWNDLSASQLNFGQGNTNAQPSLVPNYVNGQPVISFIQSNHNLSRGGIGGMPGGPANRSVFIVVQYASASRADAFYYGNGGQGVGAAYRLGVSSAGNLLFDTNNSAVDLNQPAAGQGFLLQESILQDSYLYNYKNGEDVRYLCRGLNTWGSYSDMIVGGYAQKVAEIMAYNRALNDSERLEVESYLARRYNLCVPKLYTPKVTPDGGIFTSSRQVTLSTPIAETTIRYTLDGSEPTESSATYTTSFTVASSQTVKAKVFKKNFLASDTYTANFTITTSLPISNNGLSLWLQADASLEKQGDNSVIRWLDLSGNGLHAMRSGLSGKSPLWVNNVVNSHSVIRFDGVDDHLLVDTNWPTGSELSLFVVTKGSNYQSLIRSQSDVNPYNEGFFIYPWSDANRKNQLAIGSDGSLSSGVPTGLVSQQWNIGEVLYKVGDRMSTYRNGRVTGDRAAGTSALSARRLILGSYMGQSEFTNADLAEVIIYNRKLAVGERQGVEAYLSQKYNIPMAAPVLTPDEGTFQTAQSVVLNPPANATAYYTTDNSEPSASSASYSGPIAISATTILKVKYIYQNGAVSETAIANYIIDSASIVSTSGLQLWLKADEGVSLDSNNRVIQWKDRSGHSMHASHAGYFTETPQFVTAAINGKPAITFDGTSSNLILPPGFDNFTDGVSLFVVVSPDSTGHYESYFGFGNGDSNNNLLFLRSAYYSGFYLDPGWKICPGSFYTDNGSMPVIKANTYQVLSMVDEAAAGKVRQFYRNGNLFEYALSQAIPNLTRTVNYIGKVSRTRDGLYKGSIAEILVYNRKLSDTERQRVESYLAGKYALPIAAPKGSTGGGMYSGTQTVTFTPPTGATLYYTLDGSDPTTNSSSYSGPITITEGTSIKARYYYDTGAVSDMASLDYFIDPNLPITGNGLQLWLRADIGVDQENGRVTRWRDLSGNGMHAFQQDPANLPTWIPQATDGHATIRFDGSTQFLRCPAGFADFTQGLTSFVIARPTSTGSYARFLDFGGISGSGSDNILLYREGSSQAFTFSILHGSSGASVSTTDALTQSVSQLMEVTHDGTSTGSAVIYKNGKVINTGKTWNIPNVTRYFNYIGKSNWSSDSLYQGDLNEIILYNRALTTAERQGVELYLSAKYSILLPAPTVTPDGGTFKAAQVATLSAPVGAVIYYTLDGTAPTSSSTSYSSPLSITSSLTLKAKAYYSNGASTEVASTNFVIDPNLPISTDGLSLWLRADAGIQIDVAATVGLWKDQSGNGNHAVQTVTASRPISAINATTGRPTMSFNGSSQWMRITDSSTMRPSSQITIIAAINKNSDGNKYDKILSRPYRADSSWNSPYYSYSLGEENNNQTSFCFASSGQLRALAPSVYLPNPGAAVYGATYDGSNQRIYLNGSLSATQAATGSIDYSGATSADIALGVLNPYWLTNYFGGEINEVLMYNRALTDTERQAVETYLAKKYNIGLVAPLVSPDGGTYKDSQTVTIPNLPPDAVTRYTLDGTDPTAASTSYSGPIAITASSTLKARNFYNNGALSEISTAVFVIDPVLPVPSSGLQLWLKADTAVETAPGSSTITRWKDQSASGRHAVQYLPGVRPTLAAGAINGLPAIHFDGATQFFQCLPGFADFTSGMTAIVVARPTTSASNAKFLDFGNGSPSNNIVLYRDAATAALRLDLYTGGSILALHAADGINALQPGLFQILQADYDGAQIRLYNDGYLQAQGRKQGSGGAIPNITRTLNYIGKSNWPLDALYQGDIAEILLYNRKLTDAERLAIQTYLVNRYTIGARTHTPTISPAGGTYPTTQPVTITCADMPNAEIHYTLDGTDPTINSPTYTAALNINRTTTLKAIAIANGQDPSPIATATFSINDADHDGIDDTWATQNGVTSATADTDLDGLTNLQEYLLGSDPNNADTNGDGINDGLAAKTGIPVTGVNTTSDRDHDGVPDYLDAYPDDPTKSTGDPGDTNPPTIQLTQPTNAVPVP